VLLAEQESPEDCELSERYKILPVTGEIIQIILEDIFNVNNGEKFQVGIAFVILITLKTSC